MDNESTAGVISAIGTAFQEAWTAVNPPQPGQYIYSPAAGVYVYATGSFIPVTSPQQPQLGGMALNTNTVILVVLGLLAFRALR